MMHGPEVGVDEGTPICENVSNGEPVSDSEEQVHIGPLVLIAGRARRP